MQPIQEALISNKQDLYKYLTEDFSEIFFTKNYYVQQQMRIVGPVRFRSLHTLKSQCKLESDIKNCYH